MMKHLFLVLVLAACGGKQSPAVSNSGSGSDGSAAPVQDTRTEIEKRRDAACTTLGPKITACAVEDAKRDLDARAFCIFSASSVTSIVPAPPT